MPYTIRKRGSKYLVKKKGSHKILGEHSTKKEAQKQIAAIEASEGRGHG